MRNVINVTNVIDTIRGFGRDIVVVAKRNAQMLPGTLRHLHLAMRRALCALAGEQVFYKHLPQPAYAVALSTATAGPSRCELWVSPMSHPSTRVR